MNSRLRKIESRSSFSRLLALNQKAGFADKKVIICVLCFNQFVVYSMRNPTVCRNAKRVRCFASYLSCYVSLKQALFGFSSLNLKSSRLK